MPKRSKNVVLVSMCAVPWHDGVQIHAALSDGRVFGYDDKRDEWDEMANVPGCSDDNDDGDDHDGNGDGDGQGSGLGADVGGVQA